MKAIVFVAVIILCFGGIMFNKMNFHKNGNNSSQTTYRNLDPIPNNGFKEFRKWQKERKGVTLDYDSSLNNFPVVEPNWDKIYNSEEGVTVTWVGHATLLVQFEGLNILTDPIFSDRSSPVQFAGPKRITPVPFSIEELPQIHAVVISHDHYDHLDKGTVKKLGNTPIWFVPLGLKNWLQNIGITNVLELGWWDEFEFGDFTIVSTPAQHFSGRTPFTRNRTLWSSWAIIGRKYRFWFAGDTGYGSTFKEIGERYGPFELAAIPIGAYRPEWFMLPIHVNPPQAIQIHNDVRAKQSIGIHWGTFILSDEPVDEPVPLLERSRKENGISEKEFFVLKHGETKVIRNTHR